MFSITEQKRQKLITQTTQAWSVPGVTDFGIGQPQDKILPLDILRAAANKELSKGDLHPLQYGSEYGDGYLRLALAEFLSNAYEIAVDPEPIFITNGNSQALDLVCTIFAKPGETVFVEEPSYFLALDIFRNHHTDPQKYTSQRLAPKSVNNSVTGSSSRPPNNTCQPFILRMGISQRTPE